MPSTDGGKSPDTAKAPGREGEATSSLVETFALDEYRAPEFCHGEGGRTPSSLSLRFSEEVHTLVTHQALLNSREPEVENLI